MASRVSAAFYVVLVLGLAAVGLHTVGYTMPGWLIMSRKFTVEEIQVRSTMVVHEALRMVDIEIDEDVDDEEPSMNDRDDMMMPDGRPEHDSHGNDGMMDGMPHPDHDSHSKDIDGHPPRHHRRQEDIEFIEEVTEVQEVMQTSVVDIGHINIKIMYGLWKSKICISSKMENMDDDEIEEMGEKDDSSSSSESGKKKRCHCRKLSTRCALAYAPIFYETPESDAYEQGPWHKDYARKFLGNACLTEHRVESTIGLVLLVLAVIAGTMYFRKQDSCKCWAVACILGFITALVLISIPAHRVLRHNYHHARGHMTVSRFHAPFSLITTLVAALIAFILMIVVAVAMIRRKRTTKSWARFENDPTTDDSVYGEKKGGMPPSLVFIPEPLTGKAGLYDIWGDVKPVEYVEPEKKPLE